MNRGGAITRARRVMAEQEARDVLCAAQGLIAMTRYDNNHRRRIRAHDVERDCHDVLEFLELLARVEGRES
jgi:hypothetical protein